jgi:hypothetical protein
VPASAAPDKADLMNRRLAIVSTPFVFNPLVLVFMIYLFLFSGEMH